MTRRSVSRTCCYRLSKCEVDRHNVRRRVATSPCRRHVDKSTTTAHSFLCCCTTARGCNRLPRGLKLERPKHTHLDASGKKCSFETASMDTRKQTDCAWCTRAQFAGAIQMRRNCCCCCYRWTSAHARYVRRWSRHSSRCTASRWSPIPPDRRSRCTSLVFRQKTCNEAIVTSRSQCAANDMYLLTSIVEQNPVGIDYRCGSFGMLRSCHNAR